jgi:ribosomal protein S18 acetylase RimI-like enzyme
MPLRRLSCGNRGSKPERDVNRLVREYARGKRRRVVFRATVEVPTKLLGVAAFQPGVFEEPGLVAMNGFPYVSVVGVSEDYRARRKDGVRAGDLVLLDVLGAINVDARWEGTPDVSVLVNPSNGPGCALLKRHGFRTFVPAEPGNPVAESLLVRSGAPLP